MPQNKSLYKSQAGNVFIFILMGVFLFGALMYAFSRSANQGTGNLTKQQAKIAAQEILNYARLVEGAVDRVRRNGCSETEISFDNAVVAGYSNPNSPADKSCHIFDDAGGKAVYSLNTDYLNSSFEASHTGDIAQAWGEWMFSGYSSIRGVGTHSPVPSSKELGLYLHFLNKESCFEINKNLNIALVAGDAPVERIASPPGGLATVKYIGGFYNGANGTDDGVIGAETACLKVADGGQDYYIFYHVLLAR